MVDAHHAPGWYLDGNGAYRWWDGSAWTNQTSDRQPEPVTPAEYFLPDGRYPSTDVAGESFRSDEIIAAVGRNPKLDEEIEYLGVAHLVPEPDNPHDRTAISVRVNGHVVGYIAKDEARDHLLAVQRVTASGHVVATQARIWCVRREHWEGGTRFHASVRVALPYDGIQLPQNDPPTVKYSVLPWGSAVQVSGEEQHFDAIRPFVLPEGRSLVLVTLHRSSKLLKNGQERELVEVRIDDKRIGELSTTTSRHFLPTIDHHASTATTVAAWARVEGSPLSAEVKVQGAKANELSSSWLDGAPETVGTLLPPATSYRVPPAYIGQAQTAKGEGKRKTPPAEQSPQTLAEPKGGCAAVLILLVAVPASVAYLIAQLPFWA